MPDAIALFSSSRRYGNTGRLMDRIASEVDIEIVNLDALRISRFDYEHRNRDDDFEPLMRHVLNYEHIIFASPVYWYAVAPAMKIFLDRVSDFLDLPDLLADGRRLRGKTAYVVCTSISHEASAAFMAAFRETFDYLGMYDGGAVHVNCEEGFDTASLDSAASDFARLMRSAIRHA